MVPQGLFFDNFRVSLKTRNLVSFHPQSLDVPNFVSLNLEIKERQTQLIKLIKVVRASNHLTMGNLGFLGTWDFFILTASEFFGNINGWEPRFRLIRHRLTGSFYLKYLN